MKRGALWGALAVALGAGAWFVLRPTTDAGPGGGPDGALGVEGADAPGAAGAGASGASLAKTDPSRAARTRSNGAPRGAWGVVGVVRRDGRPVAASVELVYLGDVQGRQGWSYDTWISRLLEPPKNEAGFASTRSGDDGRYAIESVGVGSYLVRARSEDGARGDTAVQVPAEAARVEANVTIAA